MVPISFFIICGKMTHPTAKVYEEENNKVSP